MQCSSGSAVAGGGVCQPRPHGALQPHAQIGATAQLRESIPQGLLEPARKPRVTQAEVSHQAIRRPVHEPCVQVAHAATIVPDVRAQSVREPLFEIVQALLLLHEPDAGMTSLQPQIHVLEVSRERTQFAAHAGTQSFPIARERIKEGGTIGYHELRRPRWGGCARIRDEIGNREVDLVAYPGDDRNRARANRARQPLVIEGPQVLQRASAAGENQHIAFFPQAGDTQGVDQRRDRSRALHGRRIDQDGSRWEAPRQDVQNVPNRRARRRGDHADPGGEARQAALELGVKKAFGGQFRLEALELLPQRSDARLLHVLRNELKLPARLIEADAAARQHFLAVARGEAYPAVLAAKHGAAQLRVAVLEGEVPVAGGGLGEVRQLTLDPDHPEPPLQQHARLAVQARNGIDVALGLDALGIGGNHPQNLNMRFTRGAFVRTIAGFIQLGHGRRPGRQPTRQSMRILEEALTFDDVLLVPAYSEILPREVDLSTRVTRKIRLNVPLLSAAMDTVTEARLAITIAQEGGIGIIHKNMSIDAQAREVGRVKKFESGVIKDPITVSPTMTIRQVLDLTRSRGISGVPVVVGKKAVGIVTHRDLRFEQKLDGPVSSVMTPQERLITVRENAPKEEVLALLHRHRIEKVLVVNADHELVGMITVKDFQKATEFPRACKDDGGRLRVGAAVGTTPDTLDRVAALRESGVDLVVVDTAHGHHRGVINTVELIKSRWADIQVIAGNIATAEAALALVSAGADAVKVGIGPGSICTTRIVAGVGVPQISAVANVADALRDKDIPVISDGGIRFSGDIAKAIVAGAHAVMLGSLFAGTEESPGEVELYQGASYKSYRGMGSLGAMAERHGSADRYFQDAASALEKLVPEGVEGRVPYKGSLVQILIQLTGGLRAAMGYTGSHNITEMRTRPTFVRITNAGVRESHVHDVSITKEAPNYRVS